MSHLQNSVQPSRQAGTADLYLRMAVAMNVGEMLSRDPSADGNGTHVVHPAFAGLMKH